MTIMISIFLLSANLFAEVNIAVIDSGSTEKVSEAISFSSIPATTDPIGHGTKITKLIKSINPDAKIHMLQVCEKTNHSYIPSPESILKAIKWCEQNKIDIVNLSLVTIYNKEIEKAIRQAHDNKGIIFIAAVGNSSMINQFAVGPAGYIKYAQENQMTQFPASSNCVISVGAKDETGRVAGYSQKKATIFEKGAYGKLSGTSFACARATGKASKILTLNPNISLSELIQSLE